MKNSSINDVENIMEVLQAFYINSMYTIYSDAEDNKSLIYPIVIRMGKIIDKQLQSRANEFINPEDIFVLLDENKYIICPLMRKTLFGILNSDLGFKIESHECAAHGKLKCICEFPKEFLAYYFRIKFPNYLVHTEQQYTDETCTILLRLTKMEHIEIV